ncbi:fibronectin type III domain-containing protein [Umezawaea sp. Da 62-37]|uniref:fibronectin type III domain-containing protein n=1 Tax=Umezawaea sp. Da 62-37 TaxID=3075927 RepID=UPI0028F70C2D|nr:fibronectin type III domain-containing protein [Umezawaea sp. Da 62-37]WNV86176.1 fibronectin type III domain-containing protein [Umezawaea sp. Da 62-37]
MHISAKWRGRAPIAVLTAICVVVVGVAVGGSAGVPGLEFLKPGHWVLNGPLATVFHIDGATKQVNAEVPVPGAEPGSAVVQGGTSGYVIGGGRITEFGESTLRVESTTEAPSDETPVQVEVDGGPYLVYRDMGVVVRLGEKQVRVPVEGKLGNPVATADGTLWLHRVDTGDLCQLPKDATVPSCAASVPAGHAGGLTVVGGKPLFVDTTADTMRLVEANGLGQPRPLGTDVPEATRVASGDVDGRVSILDPAGTLYLVDAAPLVGNRPAAENVVVRLDEGQYTGPETTGSTVALLDHKSGTLVTYDSAGTKRGTRAVPQEGGTPRLTKAEDSRVYVEGGEGRNVLVVDPGGQVTEVPVVGKPTTSPSTTPPTAEEPPPPTSENPVAPAPTTDPTTGTQEPPPPPPVVPVGPPGAPGGVSAVAGGGSVLVSWGTATDNGAEVTAYHLTWNGGALTAGPGDRSATATGLANGTGYTFTVVAENRAGRGPGASTSATPRSVATISVSRGASTTTDTCNAPNCAFPYIEMRGFAPNTAYKIDPYASEWGRTNIGAELTTDGEGTLIVDDRFPFSGRDQTFWVTAGGVESNHYFWESR